MSITAKAAEAQAQKLQARVRFHKSAMRRHRSQAQEAAQKLDAFKLDCARHGIRLIIDAPQPRRHSGNHNADTSE